MTSLPSDVLLIIILYCNMDDIENCVNIPALEFIFTSNELCKRILFTPNNIWAKPPELDFLVNPQFHVMDMVFKGYKLTYDQQIVGCLLITFEEYINFFWKSAMFNKSIVFTIEQFTKIFNELKLYEASIKNYSIDIRSLRWFSSTAISQAVGRLVSYKYNNDSPLLKLNTIIFTNRALTSYKKDIFSCYKICFDPVKHHYYVHLFTPDVTQIRTHIDFTEFYKRFNVNYFFDRWEKYINWNNFTIAGGSVLACILNKDWTTDPTHDIDIFAINITYEEFTKSVMEFVFKLNEYKYEYANHQKIKIIKLYIEQISNNIIKYKIVIIQFIFQSEWIKQNSLLDSFDIDFVQCAFDPKNKCVKVTYAFVQAFNTNTLLCYSLIDYIPLLEHKPIIRIRKYADRGLNKILLAKAMPASTLTIALNTPKVPYNPYTNYLLTHKDSHYLTINCDYFNIREKMINLICPRPKLNISVSNSLNLPLQRDSVSHPEATEHFMDID